MRFTLAAIAAAFFATVSAKQVMVDLTSTESPNALYTANLQDEVVVRLNENPSTGFSWVLINRENSNRVQALDLVKQVYIPSESQHDEIYGAGGVKEYHFSAEHEGQEPLELLYCQVWNIKPLIDEVTG